MSISSVFFILTLVLTYKLKSHILILNILKVMRKNSIYWLDFREKMVGANLYDGNIEGAFELWIERIYSE